MLSVTLLVIGMVLVVFGWRLHTSDDEWLEKTYVEEYFPYMMAIWVLFGRLQLEGHGFDEIRGDIAIANSFCMGAAIFTLSYAGWLWLSAYKKGRLK